MRPAAVDGPAVDLAQFVDVELAAVALVGERGVHAAVAHHVTARGQRGCDHLLDVLGPVGSREQRLGAMGQARGGRVVQDLADAAPDVGAARFRG